MRLRRKKNLEQRLDACKSILVVREGYEFYQQFKNRQTDDAQCKYDAGNKDSALEKSGQLIGFSAEFQNNLPVHLEIGCGKGGFACKIAKIQPKTNFVAVEKLSNVIVEACEKAMELGIENLRFANCSAENLLHFFNEKSIDRIYLNFSCPFPKKTYANRRLTSQKMLKIYDILLKDGGEIHQKTDNKDFFEFSLEQYRQYGFEMFDVTQDLHNSQFVASNIVTEYESKFIADGLPIYALKARRCVEK